MYGVHVVAPELVVFGDAVQIQYNFLLEVPLVVGSRMKLPTQGFHLVGAAGQQPEVGMRPRVGDDSVREIVRKLSGFSGGGGQFHSSEQEAGNLHADVGRLVIDWWFSFGWLFLFLFFVIDYPPEDRTPFKSQNGFRDDRSIRHNPRIRRHKFVGIEGGHPHGGRSSRVGVSVPQVLAAPGQKAGLSVPVAVDQRLVPSFPRPEMLLPCVPFFPGLGVGISLAADEIGSLPVLSIHKVLGHKIRLGPLLDDQSIFPIRVVSEVFSKIVENRFRVCRADRIDADHQMP
mmetsp:Transcript_16909/g.39054  ORF Transcript_16909/g.39054 Transcript_16909/m.39054 type:complete len:287 (+) Transcript_16909:767-1627(+)